MVFCFFDWFLPLVSSYLFARYSAWSCDRSDCSVLFLIVLVVDMMMVFRTRYILFIKELCNISHLHQQWHWWHHWGGRLGPAIYFIYIYMPLYIKGTRSLTSNNYTRDSPQKWKTGKRATRMKSVEGSLFRLIFLKKCLWDIQFSNAQMYQGDKTQCLRNDNYQSILGKPSVL